MREKEKEKEKERRRGERKGISFSVFLLVFVTCPPHSFFVVGHWWFPVDFDREMRDLAPNLNLLVLHQRKVVEMLLTALSVRNSMAAEPFLDLLVQLAKDLRGDM